MNYYKVYNALYDVGYHDKAKNHGLKYVEQIVNDYQFKSILDIGCSQGMSVKEFQRLGKDAWGIDVADIAARYAIEKYGIRQVVRGNVLCLPFVDNFFDASFSCDMMEHLTRDDVDIALNEIYRVTRKYFICTIDTKEEGNKEHYNKALQKDEYRMFMFKLRRLHQTIMPVDEWVEVFRQHNFTLIKKVDLLMSFKIENK